MKFATTLVVASSLPAALGFGASDIGLSSNENSAAASFPVSLCGDDTQYCLPSDCDDDLAADDCKATCCRETVTRGYINACVNGVQGNPAGGACGDVPFDWDAACWDVAKTENACDCDSKICEPFAEPVYPFNPYARPTIKYDTDGHDHVIDQDGNRISAGTFRGTGVNFGGRYASTIDPEYREMYIMKQSAAGSIMWIKQLAAYVGTSNSADNFSIATDSKGDIFVTGHFRLGYYCITFQDGTPDECGEGDPGVSSSKDVFFWHIGADGVALSHIMFRGAGDRRDETNVGIRIDASDNKYLVFKSHCEDEQNCPIFMDSVQIGMVADYYKMFAVKLDADNNLVYARGLGTDRRILPSDLSFDANGNLLITGMAQAWASRLGEGHWTGLPGDNPAFRIPPSDDRSRYFGFQVKLTPTGDVDWINVWPEMAAEGDPHQGEFDSDGNAILWLEVCEDSHPDYGYPNPIFGQTILSGDCQTMVVKHSAGGEFIHSTLLPSNRILTVKQMTTGRDGNIFLAGSCNGVVDGETCTQDGFVVQIDKDGDMSLLYRLATSNDDIPNILSARDDGHGNIILSGWFDMSITVMHNNAVYTTMRMGDPAINAYWVPGVPTDFETPFFIMGLAGDPFQANLDEAYVPPADDD